LMNKHLASMGLLRDELWNNNAPCNTFLYWLYIHLFYSSATSLDKKWTGM
jgi:hypothetical protein